MATKDEVYNGIKIGTYSDSKDLSRDLKKHIKSNNVTFFCVGSDRATGDSLAPLIGTTLVEKGYDNVIGTLDYPAHATNLDDRIKEIPENTTVIAIDAALGKSKSIGKFTLNKGKLHAGKALDKNLTPVGDYYINGVVNVSGYKEFLVLQNTRLSVVMNMAKEIVKSIETAFPLESEIKLSKVK